MVEGVSIAFLSPEMVLPHLKVGDRFEMWERGVIGHGVTTHC